MVGGRAPTSLDVEIALALICGVNAVYTKRLFEHRKKKIDEEFQSENALLGEFAVGCLWVVEKTINSIE